MLPCLCRPDLDRLGRKPWPGGAERMAEPMKPRALTYTEMMNGGRQQMDRAEHAREQELKQRVEDLQKDVDQLEQALGQQS